MLSINVVSLAVQQLCTIQLHGKTTLYPHHFIKKKKKKGIHYKRSDRVAKKKKRKKNSLQTSI